MEGNNLADWKHQLLRILIVSLVQVSLWLIRCAMLPDTGPTTAGPVEQLLEVRGEVCL